MVEYIRLPPLICPGVSGPNLPTTASKAISTGQVFLTVTSGFYNGHYNDALQYTKDILKSSSSIDEIIINVDNIKDNNENKDNKEKN